MSETDTNKGRWPEIILIYALSVFAVMVISEAAPALGGIAREFRPPNPAEIGWVMSMPALVAALFALGAGWIVDRIGDRRVLLWAGLLLIAGDIGVITAPSLPVILAWRIVGGLGYVSMAVAAVTMMTRRTTGRQRVAALALWSTVIPASFIVSFLIASALSAIGGWRVLFEGHAAITAALLLLGAAALPRPDPGQAAASRAAGVREVLRSPWPYVLGLSFAANAFLQTGSIAILTPLLSTKAGMSEAQIHALGSTAMLFNVLGALAVGALLNRGISAWVVGAVGTVLSAGAGLLLLTGPLTPTTAIAADCGLLLGLGVLVGLWALLPQIAPSPRSIGATSGLITQITLVGVLFGPPAAFAGLAHGPRGLLAYLAVAVVGGLIGLPVWLRATATKGASGVAH